MSIIDLNDQIDFKKSKHFCELNCPICSEKIILGKDAPANCICNSFFVRNSKYEYFIFVLYFNDETENRITFSDVGVKLILECGIDEQDTTISNKTSFSLNEIKDIYCKHKMLI